MIGAPARASTRPSAEVLDLGCGDGTMAVPGYYLVARKFPVKGSVLGRAAVGSVYCRDAAVNSKVIGFLPL
jgi:hypothetical protein